MPYQKSAKKNPPSLPPDGARRWAEIEGSDPTKDYCYVNPNDEHFGVPFYESTGWTIERKRVGGPKPRVGKTQSDGDAICVLGQYLMSIDKVEHQKIIDYGITGQGGGQKYIDSLETKITKDTGIDLLRGMHGMEVINETEKLSVERSSR